METMCSFFVEWKKVYCGRLFSDGFHDMPATMFWLINLWCWLRFSLGCFYAGVRLPVLMAGMIRLFYGLSSSKLSQDRGLRRYL